MKIWEITGKSDDNHITCQIRGKKCRVPENKKLSIKNIDLKGRIQKFRPYNFKLAKPNNKFNSPLEFLTAVQMLLSCNELTRKEYQLNRKDRYVLYLIHTTRGSQKSVNILFLTFF